MLMMGILLGCHHHDEASRQLAEMDSLIYTNPRGVLMQLDSMEGAMTLSRRDRMHLELLRGAAMNKTDSLFITDSVMLMVADYYDRYGSANERMQAHYTLGCAYRDMGDAPRAVACYQEAAHCADTLSQDCDYPTLMRVHSQMAHLYKLQKLFDEAMQEETIAEKYCWQMGDTLSAIDIEGQICSTLYNIGKTDESLTQSLQLYNKCNELELKNIANLKCLHLARCYMDLNKYDIAKIWLDKYETNLYHNFHPEQIEGRLSAIYTSKGAYFLFVGMIDSAEYYYRKTLEYKQISHNEVPVFRGLQEIYSIKNQPDSIRKYTALFSAAKERQFNVATSEATKRMKSLYNYSVEQEIAQKKSAEIQQLRSIILAASLLFFIVLFVLFFLYHLYYRRNKQKALEISDLKYQLQSNLSALRSAEEQQLALSLEKAAHADLLAKKAQEVEALKENVAHYENRLNALGSSKKGILLSSSPIINRLKYCLMAISKRPVTDNDWQELKETVERLYPTFYHDTNAHGILSEKDYRTCLLVKAGFTTTEIDHLMGLTQGSTSTNRQRLMKKVFGTEGKAKEFDQKILSI